MDDKKSRRTKRPGDKTTVDAIRDAAAYATNPDADVFLEAPPNSDPFTFEATIPVVVDEFGNPSASMFEKGPPARLEYASPDGRQHVRELLGDTRIGRHTDNDIQLLDPEVSKHHLLVVRDDVGYQLRDLGSANGTLVNGDEITTIYLTDGDLVEVGNTRLWFRQEDPANSGKTKASPFDDMLSGAPGSGPRRERTLVTLVPSEDDNSEYTTNVFALPMGDEFEKADSVADEAVLRRDYERLRVAFDLALSIGLETKLENLGESILDRICHVLPTDTAVIMLRSESGELVPLASRAESGAAEEVRIPKAIVEQVVQTRRGLLTSDAMADAQLRSSHTIVGQQIRSALCVPLVAQEEVVGVIHLSTSVAAGAYEERDLELLRAIAQPAALAVANARLVRQIQDDAKTRAVLSRFLSPALVEQVVKRDVSLETTGDKVPATVLFSDIRGFTSMSDGADPQAVVSMLNEYFESMVEIVFRHGGVLDKYIGDGLMAVWGTPVQAQDDAIRAVKAASDMRDALENHLNRIRVERGETPLEVGYGLATGLVIAGAMGARRRLDFTVIGDTVNLSSRLCGIAEPGQILVCEETARLVSGELDLNALDARSLKGVGRKVPVFELARASL